MDYYHFDFDLAGHETLAKFAAFVVVQALVYLILSNSSAVFVSGGVAGHGRSASFRRPDGVERSESDDDGASGDVELELLLIRCCSFSARRMAALLAAEMTPRFGGGEPSSPAGGGQPQGGRSTSNDDDGASGDVELELLLIRCCSFSC
uniref:Uncharacterized protein n=1 Tax=Oryza barthii TaxID=65489 RepID=A0A0D3EN66_9ORYZ